MKSQSLISLLSALAIALGLGGCRKPIAAPITEVMVTPAAALPADPADPAWNVAPEFLAKMIPQDLVEPRLIEPSTPEVRVRAVSDGQYVAFRLEWADATKNDLADPGHFVDACAVQVPAKIEPTVPAPQMGEPGRPVEIAYWNAGWQATVDGRGDSIRDLYPNAAVDHYPFNAPSLAQGASEQKEMAMRYAPAKAAGNLFTGPRKSPVQDLIAEGPGTIAPSPEGGSQGKGARTAEGWSVIIIRRLPIGLSPQAGSQVAFAVWQGDREEAGPRKMRTAWIPLVIKGKP